MNSVGLVKSAMGVVALLTLRAQRKLTVGLAKFATKAHVLGLVLMTEYVLTGRNVSMAIVSEPECHVHRLQQTLKVFV